MRFTGTTQINAAGDLTVAGESSLRVPPCSTDLPGNGRVGKAFAADTTHCKTAADGNDLFQTLLIKTSRTFALAIPRLPDDLRSEVTIAYLLFRVADTIEDATNLSKMEKFRALSEFENVLTLYDEAATRRLAGTWLNRRPIDDQDCLDLIRELPAIVDTVFSFDPLARDEIVSKARRSAAGMRRFVAAGDQNGNIGLKSLAELRQYCFFVAGLVGEMLTGLFLVRDPELSRRASDFRSDGRLFGEGLQLVNILKDSDTDAGEGRVFVPYGVPRELLFKIARSDLASAERYVAALRECNVHGGIISFCELPLELARRTLDVVEQHGPGSKVSRTEVAKILGRVITDNISGTDPVVPANMAAFDISAGASSL